MKKYLSLAVLVFTILFCSLKSYSQDSLQVLFLGNSLTYTNDIPKLIQQLAQSNNDKLTYSEHLPGGWTLYYHHLRSPISTGLIASQPWDYVILQGQSKELLYENEYTNYKGIRRLVSMMRENCSRPALYSTAAPKTLYKELQGYIHKRYTVIANEVDGLLIPVGNAFEIATDNGISVYADKVHPNPKGSYLAACVFYAALYQKSPISLSFTAGLTIAEALELQTIADSVVMGNFKDLNIYPTNPPCSHAINLPSTKSQRSYSFTVYPNPAKNRFTIKIEGQSSVKAEVFLYNIQGQKVLQEPIWIEPGTNEYSYNLNFLAGIYTLSLHSEEHVYTSQKLILQ